MNNLNQVSCLFRGSESIEVLLQKTFITNQAYAETRLFDGQQCPGYQFLMTMVSPHGIQGYLHTFLLFYFSIENKNGSALILAATAAQTMWFFWLTAITAQG
jgi:hypothetical protein